MQYTAYVHACMPACVHARTPLALPDLRVQGAATGDYGGHRQTSRAISQHAAERGAGETRRQAVTRRLSRGQAGGQAGRRAGCKVAERPSSRAARAARKASRHAVESPRGPSQAWTHPPDWPNDPWAKPQSNPSHPNLFARIPHSLHTTPRRNLRHLRNIDSCVLNSLNQQQMINYLRASVHHARVRYA